MSERWQKLSITLQPRYFSREFVNQTRGRNQVESGWKFISWCVCLFKLAISDAMSSALQSWNPWVPDESVAPAWLLYLVVFPLVVKNALCSFQCFSPSSRMALAVFVHQSTTLSQAETLQQQLDWLLWNEIFYIHSLQTMNVNDCGDSLTRWIGFWATLSLTFVVLSEISQLGLEGLPWNVVYEKIPATLVPISLNYTLFLANANTLHHSHRLVFTPIKSFHCRSEWQWLHAVSTVDRGCLAKCQKIARSVVENWNTASFTNDRRMDSVPPVLLCGWLDDSLLVRDCCRSSRSLFGFLL